MYLLFNGVLGDKRPAGGNVLTHAVAADLPAHPAGKGPRIIYGRSLSAGAEVFGPLRHHVSTDSL